MNVCDVCHALKYFAALKSTLNNVFTTASTRKVYEKRLQKLLDQGPPEALAPPSETSQTDGSQNGNADSDQYSDKEEGKRQTDPFI